MKMNEAVASRILALCRERNISPNALSRISAVPPSTVKNILYGVSKNPGVTTIKMLCDGFDITIEDFFADDIFRSLEQEIE